MRSSEILEVAGVFVGVTVQGFQEPGCRFIALHDHVRDLDGDRAADTDQLRARAQALFRRNVAIGGARLRRGELDRI